MNDFKKFTDDLINLSYNEKFILGYKDTNTISHYDNELSNEFIEKYKNLLNKYLDTDDIELKLIIDEQLYYYNNNLHLLLFSSYNNLILDFYNDNIYLYPKNKNCEKLRIIEFDIYMRQHIISAKEGLKLNITHPKIIIKKFLSQIKSLNKYKYLYDFILKTYYPKCRDEIGLCYLKNGKEHYKYIIKDYLGQIDLSPEDIHKIGLDLLKKTNKHKNTYSSRNELFKDCIKYNNHIFTNIIKNYFDYVPKKICIIEAMNATQEISAPLAYYKPLEHKVFINLSLYKEVSKNEIYSLIMHEVMHSFHFEYMQKHFKVPKYKYYICSNTALTEGFAHYMETYCENYDDTNNEMSLLRKLRLVVDTGINYYGWTYKQAFNFMKKYLPNKTKDINNEIDRYITMPGQALCYYIGKLHIIKLRDNFLKTNNDLKVFHRKLLMHGLVSFKTIDNEFN